MGEISLNHDIVDKHVLSVSAEYYCRCSQMRYDMMNVSGASNNAENPVTHNLRYLFDTARSNIWLKAETLGAEAVTDFGFSVIRHNSTYCEAIAYGTALIPKKE